MIAFRIAGRLQVDVRVSAVAASGSVGKARPVATPHRTRVLRFAVAQQRDIAAREIMAVVLIKLVSPDRFGENEELTTLRIKTRVVDSIRKKGQLSARAAGLFNEVDLIRIGKPGEDQHAFFDGIPVEENGCARFGVTPNLFRDLRGNRRNAIEHEAVGWSEILRAKSRGANQ